jgi:hypothetical protein
MSIIDSVENTRIRSQAIAQARMHLDNATKRLKTIDSVNISDINMPAYTHEMINSILRDADTDVRQGVEQIAVGSMLKHAYNGNFIFKVQAGTPTALHHFAFGTLPDTIVAQAEDNTELFDVFNTFQPNDQILVQNANTPANDGLHALTIVSGSTLTTSSTLTADTSDTQAIITLVRRNNYRFTVDLLDGDTAGGIFGWTNPLAESIRVTRLLLKIDIPVTGLAVDIGTALSATTLSDNIIEELQLESTLEILFDTPVILAQVGSPDGAISCSTATGAAAGLVGTMTVEWEKL